VTSQAERTSPPGQAQPSQEADDRDAFAEMFEAHAQHLFDYCDSLLGDRPRAVSATQVTLIAAHSLANRLKDTGRMRAFVLALGRWECLSGEHGATGPEAAGSPGTEDLAAALAFVDEASDDPGEPATGELTLSDFEAASGLSLRAMLAALPREDREILDLLYRHDVSMADLGPLLGVQAGSVPRMVSAAKARFAAQATQAPRLAAAGEASPDVRAEQLSAVRLLTLPASVWRRTARVVIDPRFSSYRDAVTGHAEHLGPDGFPVQPTATPSGRKLLLTSALMAGLLLAPAAVGGVGYAAFSAISHVVDHAHSTAVPPGGPTTGGPGTGGTAGAGLAGSAGGAKRTGSKAKGSRGTGLVPLPHDSVSGSEPTKHKVSSSPAPTSRYSSSSSPSPTKSATSPTSPPPSSSPPSSSPPPSSPPPSPSPSTSSAATTASSAAASASPSSS
jgi:DNA-directed RNA polymerase specialized sigma24 family protein